MSAIPVFDDNGQTVDLSRFANLDPFKDLPEGALSAVAQVSEERRYGAGQSIFSLGQYDGSEFYIVVSGVLKVSQIDPASGSVVLERYVEGQIYGLDAAIYPTNDGKHERLTMEAENDLVVVAIDSEQFSQVVASRPTLTRNLMIYFARQVATGTANQASSEASPERQVFAALSSYVERDAVNGEWRIEKMPKHRELAEKSGVEESVAAQAIAHIIQEGIARRDYPGLIIDDMNGLSRLSN